MPFKKGQSGNPGGRLGVPKEVRELARTHTKTAIDRLVDWMKSDDPRASVAACNSLLDRGYGKAVTPVEVGDAGEFDHLSDKELAAELRRKAAELRIPMDVVEGMLGGLGDGDQD